MPLITLNCASLAFGHYPLLKEVDFQLDTNERVGLIGRNGTGKSSLLKVLVGETKLDDGKLWIDADVRLAYVPQEPALDPEQTVFETVAEGLGELQQLLTEYHKITTSLAVSSENTEVLLTRLQTLQQQLEAQNGWTLNSTIESVLSRLNLHPDTKIRTLSGGWRKRVALAKALVINPEVLLLDEPTNHLDLTAIEWLENLLLGFKGSVLFITHDRRFLDKLATRIIELDRGRITEFPGNFTQYQAKKAELLQTEAAQSAEFDKFLAQEEVWIRKGIEARRTRNEGRVRRLEALRLERAARRERQGQVKLNLDAGERSGKLVAELDRVQLSLGGKHLLNGFSTRILRGDRIGLLGPNGIGKTTLLKLILGELEPDSGTVTRGSKLSVAYFDQMREQLNEEATLADTISPGSDFVEIAGEKKHVISYLEDFLFAPQRARSPVKSLSGGERNRLLLARLFARPANVLVLDEPTNDLDIDTLELLENLLQDYAGTLFLVSHDRTFLENTVTQVIAFEGDGMLTEFGGGYDDWQRFTKQRQTPTPAAKITPSADTKPTPVAVHQNTKQKLSFKEKQELADLPNKISILEKELAEIHQLLAEGSIYKTDAKLAVELAAKTPLLDEAILTAMERWETLESRNNS